MKPIKKVLLVLVVLVAAILIFLSFFVGSALKTAVTTIGPQVLGVPMGLEKAAVYPLRGKAKLTGLTIGNPEGFNSEHAFRLDEIEIALKPLSFLSDTIHIEKIYIDAPEITFEGSLTGSNIGKLLKQIEENTGGGEADEKSDEEEAKDEPGDAGKKVIIDHFLLENGEVTLSMKLVKGVGAGVPVALPTVEMRDIGKEDKATFATVLKKVFTAIIKAVMDVVKGSVNVVGDGAGAAGDVAADAAAAAGDAAADAAAATGEALGEAAEGAAEAIGEGADKLIKGLGGFLKKED